MRPIERPYNQNRLDKLEEGVFSFLMGTKKISPTTHRFLDAAPYDHRLWRPLTEQPEFDNLFHSVEIYGFKYERSRP